MSYTKGPWAVRWFGIKKSELAVCSTVHIEDKFDGGTYEPVVADLYRGGTGNVYDAYLIAAAPELLEALQAVVRVADRSTVEFDSARAAITKALGQ